VTTFWVPTPWKVIFAVKCDFYFIFNQDKTNIKNIISLQRFKKIFVWLFLHFPTPVKAVLLGTVEILLYIYKSLDVPPAGLDSHQPPHWINNTRQNRHL